jgi:hypothetical protein
VSLLSPVPGILRRAFGSGAVEYQTGPTTWVAITDAHYGAPQRVLEFDGTGERETEVESIQVSAPAATAPTLAVGARLRLSPTVVYAVRAVTDDTAHGIVRWLADRRIPREYGPDRGATR